MKKTKIFPSPSAESFSGIIKGAQEKIDEIEKNGDKILNLQFLPAGKILSAHQYSYVITAKVEVKK